MLCTAPALHLRIVTCMWAVLGRYTGKHLVCTAAVFYHISMRWARSVLGVRCCGCNATAARPRCGGRRTCMPMNVCILYKLSVALLVPS
jgi:hypothetical protein